MRKKQVIRRATNPKAKPRHEKLDMKKWLQCVDKDFMTFQQD